MGHGNGAARLGVQPQATDRTIPIDEVARMAAERGYASIFVCEHTHIPVAGRSVSPRGEMPEWVKHTWDPFIALAFAAAQTELEIGTAVALPAEHDPIVLAKVIATLDRLSGGRLVLGVGWGWHREEFTDHNDAPANRRVAVLREKLGAMRALWTEDEASYAGQHVQVQRSWSWPKPAQPQGPPVLLGVPSEQRNFDRIAAWADGWIPMSHGLLDDTFAGQLAALRRTWEQAGRDPALLDVTVLHAPGPVDEVHRALDRATELGVRRVLIPIAEAAMGECEAIMDRLAPLTAVG